MDKRGELESLVKSIIWVILFVLLATGVYFLLDFITGF